MNNEMAVSQRILAGVEPKIQVDFTKPEGFGRKKRAIAARFPMNLAAYWGPKPRTVGYKRKQEDE